MAEALKMVHLTPGQRKRRKFNHLLTGNAARPMTEKRLNTLLSIYFDTSKEDKLRTAVGKELMTNYLRLLGSTVGRYLYHWPVSRRFLDEMISVGTEAIVKIITKLKPEQLEKENNSNIVLGHLIENAIRHDIETVINNLRGIAPASERTNRNRETICEKPIYGLIEASLTSENIKDSQEYNDIDSFLFEVRDSIEKIAQTKLEKQVLAQENWGLSNAELSKKLGKSVQWILEIRNRLRERYQKLGEN